MYSPRSDSTTSNPASSSALFRWISSPVITFDLMIDRAFFQRQAAPLGAGRLGIDGGDLMTLRHQLGQGRHREIRRAEKSETKSH